MGFLTLGASSVSVQADSLVLFNICDAYLRRNEGQERVIGSLLGTISDGVVHIKNCYTVPHTDSSDQVLMDTVHFATSLELHQKVNPREVLVGWFSTGVGVSVGDTLIQDFYAGKCNGPCVHVTVDTALNDNKLTIQAFSSKSLTLGDRQLAAEFQQVPCKINTADVEKVGPDLIDAELTDKVPNSLESLELSVQKLKDTLDEAYKYVDDVTAKRRPGSYSIGRYIADTITAIPRISKDEFEKLFHDGVQDVLIVMYLAHLVRAHIALADKLGTAALPLV